MNPYLVAIVIAAIMTLVDRWFYLAPMLFWIVVLAPVLVIGLRRRSPSAIDGGWLPVVWYVIWAGVAVVTAVIITYVFFEVVWGRGLLPWGYGR